MARSQSGMGPTRVSEALSDGIFLGAWFTMLVTAPVRGRQDARRTPHTRRLDGPHLYDYSEDFFFNFLQKLLHMFIALSGEGCFSL